MKYPILMADIIDSGHKNSNILIAQLKTLVSYINKKYKAELMSPLTITLGDEFQCVGYSMQTGLKIIFELEELIIEKEYDIKLRYVLLYGKIDTEINSRIAYEMLGDGLTNARKFITELKKDDRRIFFHDIKNELSIIVNDALFIYQSFVDDWKPKDKISVNEFLKNDNYKIVANKIKTDPSSAWRRRKSLKIREYKAIKSIILKLTLK